MFLYCPASAPHGLETQNMDPTAFSPPAIRAPERAPSPFNMEPFEPRPASDFERQADDIIANFRARQGLPLEL